MRSRGTGLAFALGLLLLVRSPFGMGQQPSAGDSDNWMLEITRAGRAPHYARLSADGKEAQTVFNKLDWLPGWDRTDKDQPQFTGLGFIYRMEGTELSVRVYLELDSAENTSDAAAPMTVGTFPLHPGESVTVAQLSQFGLQPVQVKLVTAKPPDATPPEIVNETSSLVVENVDQDRAEYKLSVRNASELAVEAVVVSVFDTQGHCKMHSFGVWAGPVIPPEATGGFKLSFPVAGEDEGVVGADGQSCSNAPDGLAETSPETPSSRTQTPRIVIEAVVFPDGSYEGDARKAALLKAERLEAESARSKQVARTP